MTEVKPDHDPDRDHDPANGNGRAITSAPNVNTLLASTALMALAATFKMVDTSSVSNRSIHPLMQFKSREGGTWAFGQRRTIPEPDSLWAINPASFQWGWVCWRDGKVIGEKLVSISEPLPDVTKLSDTGFPWQQEMAVNMKCVSGVDAGTEVVFKTNTEGGRAEISQIIDAVRHRFDEQHEGKVSPIVKLESSSYPHPQYGKTWIPVMPITDWMLLDGPAPAPEPASPPPTEQPRRRRIA
jgi:hypothetical protein